MNSGFGRDLKSAWRFLSGSKGWTAVAVVSLALAIGANTVVFSIVDSVLFRPFPYRDPDEVVLLWSGRDPTVVEPLSLPDLEDIRAQSRTLESVAWYQPTANLSPGIEPSVSAGRLGPGVFEVLGVGALLGRTFTEDDEGASRVILSYGFWQSRYGGDPGVVGQTLDLNSEPNEIVGVMPRGFFFPEPAVEFWVPGEINDFQRTNRDSSLLRAVARLSAGTPIETARAELDLISQPLNSEYTRRMPLEASVFPVAEIVLGDYRTVLGMLLGAVGCVLLIGCVNVANLLLARGAARQKELALRATLGASRTTLIRQLLTESLLLAVGAGLAALALGYAGIRLVPALGVVDIPRIDNASMNWLVIGFALGISVLTGLVSGVLPALRASRVDLTSSLKTGTQSSSHSGNNRIQDALVVGEVGVSLVLLIAAGLLVRSSVELGRIDWGFDPEGLAVVSARWQGSFFQLGTGVSNEKIRFAESALERIRGLDGIEAASAGVTVPLVRNNTFAVAERVVPQGGVASEAVMANRAFVTRDYFEAVGIEVDGREFDEGDRPDGQKVVVLSRSLAADLFPDEDPLGKTIRFLTPAPEEEGEGGNQPRGIAISFDRGGLGTLTIMGEEDRPFEVGDKTAHTVIGIADDVRMSDDPTDSVARSMMYVDYRQAENLGLQSDVLLGVLVQPGTFVIRSGNLTRSLIDQTRSILVELDPDISFFEAAPMADLVSKALGGTGSSQLMLVLGVVFATISLILASVGIYGVMSHAVGQRTWEIGVRMSIGATPTGILMMILKRAVVLAGLGLVIGLGGAWAASRLLENRLFGITTTDPLTFALVSLCLVAVAVAASLAPAFRASRVDPLTATRSE